MSNGFVLQCVRRSDGAQVAVKFLSTDADRHRTWRPWKEHPKYGRVPQDVLMLDQLDHENIIKLLDVFRDDTYV